MEHKITETLLTITGRQRVASSLKSSSTQDVSTQSYDKYLYALRTKPFLLLAGISGTGKSRIVRELAFKSCPAGLPGNDKTTPGNYCMIEVKPNWHDSTDLLGYYSNISKSYQFTKFVKFLVKAMMFPDVPFFVCLDEMNLAPVEQYFAEFLSVLETRKLVDGVIQSGTLVDHQYFKELNLGQCKNDGDVYTKLFECSSEGIDEEASHRMILLEKGLTLPSNVFIIGTVNMDDTTHQFSRKVIDRAMTIEMNGGKLMNMFGRSVDLDYLPADKMWHMEQFASRYVCADEVLEAHPAEAEQMKADLVNRLEAVNEALKNTPFQISFRVLNELCIYTAVLLDDGMEYEAAVNNAVDQIALMKILPRIEGDEDMFAIKGLSDRNKLDELMNCLAGCPDSCRKLEEMNERLKNGSGFTRFWP